MSEQEQQTSEPQGDFQIQKIYVEDISVESPSTPSIFKDQWKPEANVELNTQSEKLDVENMYKVALSLTVTTKSNDKTAFLIEIKQAGVFLIKGMPEDQMGHILGSFCPSVLFPYAREAISSMVTRAGFPDLQLAPINFDALYAQGVAQAQQENQPESETEK